MARTWIRQTQRCTPTELPPGSDVAISSGAADALTFRIDDHNHDAPIYVVSVPTAWRVGILVDGQTHWTETTEPHPWQLAETMLEGGA